MSVLAEYRKDTVHLILKPQGSPRIQETQKYLPQKLRNPNNFRIPKYCKPPKGTKLFRELKITRRIHAILRFESMGLVPGDPGAWSANGKWGRRAEH